MVGGDRVSFVCVCMWGGGGGVKLKFGLKCPVGRGSL